MPTQKEIKNFQSPKPTTDAIIEYKGGIVLIERHNFPYGLALPGGFAEIGLTFEQNMQKEAMEEVGLEIKIENPNRPWVYSDPNRDPRGHFTANVYIAQGFGDLKAGDDAKKAAVYSIDQIRELVTQMPERFAFEDHALFLREYLLLRGHLK